MKIHFIAIGGSAMHNLALALYGKGFKFHTAFLEHVHNHRRGSGFTMTPAYDDSLFILGLFILFYQGDENIRQITCRAHSSVKVLPYECLPHTTRNGKTYLRGNEETELQIFGLHNMQNLAAAFLACREIGIPESDFLKAIASYKGAAKRLQKIAETPQSIAYLDFAHSPSKLKATIQAVKEQYPDKKLIACMELHTFSSLNAAFLPQYKNCMDQADTPVVFFNPEVVIF